ncbi:MAG: hypothetical protein ACYDHY_07670 [Acidiferrobacterales bacterium]
MSKGLDIAMSLLREWGFYGTFDRPDNSGIRGKGGPAAQGIQLKRAGSFPYDNDNTENGYGQPNAYDRGSRGASGQIHNPIVPKDVTHSAWDDAARDSKSEFEDDPKSEGMGSPENFGISDDSELGSMLPGANGHGWNGKPVKPWDDDEGSDHVTLDGGRGSGAGMTQDEGGGPMGLHPQGQLRKPQKIPNAPYPQDDHETAGEDDVGFKLELSDPEEYGSGTTPASAIAIKATTDPFMQGRGRAGKSTRGQSSTNMWQESAWAALERFLVQG